MTGPSHAGSTRALRSLRPGRTWAAAAGRDQPVQPLKPWAEGLLGRVDPLVDVFQEPLLALAPAVRRLAASIDPTEVEAVVVPRTLRLAEALLAGDRPQEAGSWWSGPDAQRRTRVWEALDMVSALCDLDQADALQVIKAHAFATGRVVDDIAADLLARRIDVGALGGLPD